MVFSSVISGEVISTSSLSFVVVKIVASPKLPDPCAVVIITSSSKVSLLRSKRKKSVSLFFSITIGELVANPLGVIVIVLRLSPTGLVSVTVIVFPVWVVSIFV